jgi:flavin reductase (DIM6/NTAB) family NADH-FMN oxidoreductase RutF
MALVTSSPFDTLMAHADSALVVVTTASDDQRAGCVVGFHTQCSIEPVRYAVWFSKANFTYRVSLFATHLAVHFLGADDMELAELFGATTGDRFDKFAHCEWEPGPGGVPLLDRCPNRLVLARTSAWDDGGDHVCLVGAPVHAEATTDLVPLRLSAGHDIDAGHPVEERGEPSDLHAEVAEEPPDPDGGTSRHELEGAAAGAGHRVDLSRRDASTTGGT